MERYLDAAFREKMRLQADFNNMMKAKIGTHGLEEADFDAKALTAAAGCSSLDSAIAIHICSARKKAVAPVQRRSMLR